MLIFTIFKHRKKIVREYLKNKISDAIQEQFVGNYTFTSGKLDEIYQYLGFKSPYIVV